MSVDRSGDKVLEPIKREAVVEAPVIAPPAVQQGLVRRQTQGGLLLQTKLDVGAAYDPLEGEADRVARAVVRRISAGAGDTAVLGETDELEHRHTGSCCDHHTIGRVQRKAAAEVGLDGGEVDAATEQLIRNSAGSGAPLAEGVRRQMESGFGSDFSQIRTHTGSQANELNDRIQAKAFTLGNDIYFRGGAPDTSSTSGQELLAHELTHTIQQGGGSSAQRITRAQRRVQRAEEKIGTELVECADEAEKTEAGEIIARIKSSYGIDVSSLKTKEAIIDQYTEVPADVTAALTAKAWRLIDLRSLDEALAFYGPILGASREGSTRKDTDQEVTSVGKLDQAIDKNSKAGQLDTTTLGEYFRRKKNMGLFGASHGHYDEFDNEGEELTATFIHEIAHGILSYGLPDFITASQYWSDRNTPLPKKQQKEAPATSYGKTNAAEDMCDCASLYFIHPDRLLSAAPLRHAFFKQLGDAWIPAPVSTPMVAPTPEKAPDPVVSEIAATTEPVTPVKDPKPKKGGKNPLVQLWSKIMGKGPKGKGK